MWGFVPTRRDTIGSVKVPKTIPARARPHGGSPPRPTQEAERKFYILKDQVRGF